MAVDEIFARSSAMNDILSVRQDMLMTCVKVMRIDSLVWSAFTLFLLLAFLLLRERCSMFVLPVYFSRISSVAIQHHFLFA